jgi:hypothetical protein
VTRFSGLGADADSVAFLFLGGMSAINGALMGVMLESRAGLVCF